MEETYDWLCTCGRWNEDWPFHCKCGRQPPCGCDCDECNMPEPEPWEQGIWDAYMEEIGG